MWTIDLLARDLTDSALRRAERRRFEQAVRRSARRGHVAAGHRARLALGSLLVAVGRAINGPEPDPCAPSYPSATSR